MSVSKLIKQIHTDFNNNNVLYAFNGEVNNVNIVAFLKIIEGYLLTENNHQLKRKLSQILVEVLQNINKHGLNYVNNKILNSTLIVTFQPNGFLIYTCSNIENTAVLGLKTKIDYVNSLNFEELNTYYKTCLKCNTISDKGGAGLGIIEIVKKSENKIEYTFDAVTDHYSVLTMHINVTSK